MKTIHLFFNSAPILDESNLLVPSDSSADNQNKHPPANEQPSLRRSNRISRPPNWHNDFLIASNSSTAHPLANLLSYDYILSISAM